MSEYIAYLEEVFEALGEITTRKMFGGYGLYYDAVMFALVANNTLYLKADDSIVKYFSDRGLESFKYQKGEKTFSMSYYLAPEELYDDQEVAREWALRSYDVAFKVKGISKNVSTTEKNHEQHLFHAKNR